MLILLKTATRLSAAKRQTHWIFPALAIVALFCGCGKKAPDRQSAKPSDLPAEMVEGIVQQHWIRDSIKVKSISYGEPFPSKGGRVPPGVKIIPATVRLSFDGRADKDVQLYFYQSPFGSWEIYE